MPRRRKQWWRFGPSSRRVLLIIKNGAHDLGLIDQLARMPEAVLGSIIAPATGSYLDQNDACTMVAVRR